MFIAVADTTTMNAHNSNNNNNQNMLIESNKLSTSFSTMTSPSSAPKRSLTDMVQESGKRWANLFHEEETDDECTSLTEEYVGDSESEEESEIAHVMAKRVFSKSPSTPVFDVLLRSVIAEQAKKRIKLNNSEPCTTGAPGNIVRLSASTPNLPNLARKAIASETKARKPNDCLVSILSQASFRPKFYSPRALPVDFFKPLSPEQTANYDSTLVRAVRDSNLPALRAVHEQNGTLHAGNKFGETILHSACRRGATEVVRTILAADHPVRVCCDAGRTILHDAAWTHAPVWNVMDMILDACPDLLYIQDRRGYTPLDYVPVDQREEWCAYLERRGVAGLRPTILE